MPLYNPQAGLTANTFTGQQTISPPTNGQGLTIKTDPSIYGMAITDRSGNPILELGNLSGSNRAGAIVLSGENGLGTGGHAWSLGIDTSQTPVDRDFFIAKINANDSATDILYIHNNGASPADVEIFTAGSSYPTAAGLTVNGEARAGGDPVLLQVRPTIDQALNAFEIRRLDTTTAHAPESQPTFRIHGDPAIGLAFGTGAATPDSRIVRTSTGGLRAQLTGAATARAFTVENSRTKQNGDIAQMFFAADGFDLVRMEADYNSGAASGGYTVSTNNNGTWQARFRADVNGVGFFAKAVSGSTVGTSVAAAAVVTTSATQTTPWGFATQAQADGIVTLVNNLRAEIRALGLLT